MVELTVLIKDNNDYSFLKKDAQKVISIARFFKDIDIVLVSESFIKKVNNKYRGKNAPTDVLSFEDLNEIFICPAYIKKKHHYGQPALFIALTQVLIHGILHLVGYDHERSEKEANEMFAAEKRIFKKINQ